MDEVDDFKSEYLNKINQLVKKQGMLDKLEPKEMFTALMKVNETIVKQLLMEIKITKTEAQKQLAVHQKANKKSKFFSRQSSSVQDIDAQILE